MQDTRTKKSVQTFRAADCVRDVKVGYVYAEHHALCCVLEYVTECECTYHVAECVVIMHDNVPM